MESSKNFLEGLIAARDEMAKLGRLAARDDRCIDALAKSPVMMTPTGTQVFALRRLHLRTRRLYRRSEGVSPVTLDWTSLVDWIIEHWADILRFLFTIAPFII